MEKTGISKKNMDIQRGKVQEQSKAVY